MRPQPGRIALAHDAVWPGSLRACDEARRRYFREVNVLSPAGAAPEGLQFFGVTSALGRGAQVGRVRRDLLPQHAHLLRRARLQRRDRALLGLVERLYLLLGHSESLLDRTTEFEPMSAAGGMVYRKRTAA
jgi:hypothetical protein